MNAVKKEAIVIQERINNVITEEMIAEWFPQKPVVIKAQTGQGKTYWVAHNLYDYLKKNGATCLYLIQRTRTKEQLLREFRGKESTLRLMTYQALESSVQHGQAVGSYDYIVADECHYFISDGGFNNNTDISFDWILGQDNAVKIFMSATVGAFYSYLFKKVLIAHAPITTPYDYGYIDHLTFFYDTEQLETLAADVISKGKKAVFFIQSGKTAAKLYKKFKNNMVFSCSRYNKEHKHLMDENLINAIIEDEKFDANILITTTALDSGFTLKDNLLDTIVVDVVEPEAVIQCVGRKRPVNSEDHIDLFIRGRSNSDINRIIHQMNGMIKTIIQKDTDELEYHIENERQNNINGAIVNVPVGCDSVGNLLYIKQRNEAKVTRLEYYALDLFPEMLKEPFGYDKYLARWFGFYDDTAGLYSYQTISTQKQTLMDYLAAIVGMDMFTVKDRKHLIEAVAIKDSKGKLQRNILTLNTYFQEENLPYTIVSRRKTKVINGVKKNFTSVWTVVKLEI